MNWIANFMRGRYGRDTLGLVLLVSACVLTFTGQIVDSIVVLILSYVIMFAALFRMFSKNVYARAKENAFFLQHTKKPVGKINELVKLLFGTKTHRYYHCTGCKQMVRVPKGRGKVKVTCPKCQNSFIKKT